MIHLKTYEGFFDFFKNTEDDKIALGYINRLKKITDISPYEITYERDTSFSHTHFVKYNVLFDDTPIRSTKISSENPFSKESQKLMLDRGFIKYSSYEFYALSVDCSGERESVKASSLYLKELFDLCEKVYKNDKEGKRLKKIKSNINRAADLSESLGEDDDSENNIVLSIKDMLIDLEDDGLSTAVDFSISPRMDQLVNIIISNHDELDITNKLVFDILKRVFDFLIIEKYNKYEVSFNGLESMLSADIDDYNPMKFHYTGDRFEEINITFIKYPGYAKVKKIK